MQTHVVQLTKQRLSDFFVKEDGHVAHKNALVAGTVATGAIFAALMLAPDAADAHHTYPCGDTECLKDEQTCCSRNHNNEEDKWEYFCPPIDVGCP
ncbi:hypothetical protein C6500_02935 [Candidatus Poribacteria bacterium]|nr:MAG: hypothetical protein C6500_02935 [Candidatus Poribacteria bacterium]